MQCRPPPYRLPWLDPARPNSECGILHHSYCYPRQPCGSLLLSTPAVRHAVQIAKFFSTHLSRGIFQMISYQLVMQKLIFDNLYSVNYPRYTELPQIGNKPTLFRCAVRDVGAMQRAADLGRSNGGVMRIGRTIIIQAILTLGVAGSIAASAAVPATTVAAPSSHVHTVAMAPNTWYHM